MTAVVVALPDAGAGLGGGRAGGCGAAQLTTVLQNHAGPTRLHPTGPQTSPQPPSAGCSGIKSAPCPGCRGARGASGQAERAPACGRWRLARRTREGRHPRRTAKRASANQTQSQLPPPRCAPHAAVYRCQSGAPWVPGTAEPAGPRSPECRPEHTRKRPTTPTSAMNAILCGEHVWHTAHMQLAMPGASIAPVTFGGGGRAASELGSRPQDPRRSRGRGAPPRDMLQSLLAIRAPFIFLVFWTLSEDWGPRSWVECSSLLGQGPLGARCPARCPRNAAVELDRAWRGVALDML